MLLVIDVGNTNITLGVFDKEELTPSRMLTITLDMMGFHQIW